MYPMNIIIGHLLSILYAQYNTFDIIYYNYYSYPYYIAKLQIVLIRACSVLMLTIMVLKNVSFNALYL